MMKYLSNQPFDFSNPNAAFIVASMQIIGGLAAEVTCIIYLSSLKNALDVIIRFVALSSIARVDDLYNLALPSDGNKIKKTAKKLLVKVHRRDWQVPSNSAKANELMDSHRTKRKMYRIIYRGIRALYASYIFYFMPYTSVWFPYVISGVSTAT